jgi:16S rRNA processing protein RimM
VSSAWIPVGRVLRTRGRIGEFIVEIDSSHPGRAELLKRVLLRKPPRESEFVVARLWYHSGRPIFQFEGIDSISAAEPWEGAEILVPAEEKIAPEPDEFFHDDLIGCVVEDRGTEVGMIEAVHETAGHALLELRTKEGKEVLIPFAKAFLKHVDLPNKRIRVELPEGLLEL